MPFLILWGVLTAGIWAVYGLYRADVIAALEYGDYPVAGFLVPVMAALCAAGPAMLAAILWRNGLTGMARPGVWTWVATLVMTLLTPFANLEWFPLFPGMMLVFGFWPPQIMMYLIPILLVWLAALMVVRANVPDRLGQLFCLLVLWGAAYGGVMLWQGVGRLVLR